MESIKILESIDRGFKETEESKKFTTDLLNSIVKFTNIQLREVYSDLIDSHNRVFLLNEFTKIINSIEASYKTIEKLCNSFNPYDYLNVFMGNDNLIYNEELNKIKPLSKTLTELENDFEWKSIRFDETDDIIVRLKKDISIAKRAHQRQKLNINEVFELNKQKTKEYSFVLGINFELFMERLGALNVTVQSMKASATDKRRIRAFVNHKAVYVAFNVFVENELIEDISFDEFYVQIDNLDIESKMTLIKEPKNDKYIAYAIIKLENYIFNGKKIPWKDRMLNYFDIDSKNVGKIIPKDESNKMQKHKAIDYEFRILE